MRKKDYLILLLRCHRVMTRLAELHEKKARGDRVQFRQLAKEIREMVDVQRKELEKCE